MIHDLRLVFRGLRKKWLSFALTIAMVGVSAGSTALVFVVMDALVLHPIPSADSRRVVHLGGLASTTPNGDPVAWWGAVHALERIACYSTGEVSVEGEGGTRWANVALVSPDFFNVFNAAVAPGRSFDQTDQIAGQDRVVIVSRSFAKSYFAGRASPLGAQLRLNGASYSVIGVAMKGFSYPVGTSLWIPRSKNGEGSLTLLQDPTSEKQPPGWVALLRPGISISEASAELSALLKHMNEEYSPRTHLQYGGVITVHLLTEDFTRNYGPALSLLLAGAIATLLVAAMNYFVFLAGRSAERRKEFAVRRVLGARVSDIVRQSLVETGALGTLSGLVGLLTALLLLYASRNALPAYLVELQDQSSVTMRACAAGFLLAFSASMLVSAALALLVSSKPQFQALKENSGAFTGMSGRRWRRAFVVLQVSLSFVLAGAALLSLESYFHLSRSGAGYDTERTVAAHLTVPFGLLCSQVPSPAANNSSGTTPASNAKAGAPENDSCAQSLGAFEAAIIAEVRALPDVSTAAVTERLPISNEVEGWYAKHDDVYKFCSESRISSEYFRVFQIPIAAGQTFSVSAQPQAIVSETMAREFWPAGNPVGSTISIDGENQPRVVVGIVKNTAGIGATERPAPKLYIPFSDAAGLGPGAVSMNLAVRCQSSCAGIRPALLERLKAAGADIFVNQIASVDELSAAATAPIRARTLLLSGYGLVAMGLALVGVFVLVSYMSVLREREFGIRMVFGAEPANLVFLLAKEGIFSAAAGFVLGAVASFFMARIFRSMLYGVETPDLLIFAAMGIVLFFAAILAAVVPAMQMRVREPSSLLRVV
jgi:hypothetical protein